VVKSAVVHDDGGLVTEIIEDTQYLSSVNLRLVFKPSRGRVVLFMSTLSQNQDSRANFTFIVVTFSLLIANLPRGIYIT